MLTPRTAASPSRLVVRFALAGMTLAVVGLGALALWAAVVSETGASRVTGAAVQTAGHLQAVQALSKIDNQTDALEEEYDPRTVRSLRRAQRALDGALDRMASGGEREAARISRQSRPIVRGMGTAIDQFVSAREGEDDGPAVERAEEAMEDRIHELETVMHEIRHDPSAVLTGELESVTDALGDVRGAALVLVPLGLVFVGFAAWLLHGYRRRSEAAMRIALEASEVEARTDQLTGLANRRALLEALEQAVESGDEFLLAVADLNGFKQYNDTFGHPAGDARPSQPRTGAISAVSTRSRRGPATLSPPRPPGPRVPRAGPGRRRDRRADGTGRCGGDARRAGQGRLPPPSHRDRRRHRARARSG